MTDQEGTLKVIDDALADPTRDDDAAMEALATQAPGPTIGDLERQIATLTGNLNQFVKAVQEIFLALDLAVSIARVVHDKAICTDATLWTHIGERLKTCEKLRKHYGDQLQKMGIVQQTPPPAIVTPRLVLK